LVINAKIAVLPEYFKIVSANVIVVKCICSFYMSDMEHDSKAKARY
jgi:hypothetical protein